MGAPSPTRQGVQLAAVKRLVAESVSDWVHSSSTLPIRRTKSTEAVRLRIVSTSKTRAFRNLPTIASISSERSVAAP
jgi:hypothetical protein